MSEPAKLCVKCRVVKLETEFYRWRQTCKECVRSATAQYRHSNKNRVKLTKRRYYLANRPEFLKRSNARYAANKTLIIEQTRERERRYRREKIHHIIARRIGKRLAKVLDGKRPKGWKEQLGYDPELLVPHLEAQFEDWMSWENYGREWHIDHIRPVSTFKFPDQIRECWALSNLRPLRSLDNLQKGATWVQAA